MPTIHPIALTRGRAIAPHPINQIAREQKMLCAKLNKLPKGEAKSSASPFYPESAAQKKLLADSHFSSWGGRPKPRLFNIKNSLNLLRPKIALSRAVTGFETLFIGGIMPIVSRQGRKLSAKTKFGAQNHFDSRLQKTKIFPQKRERCTS